VFKQIYSSYLASTLYTHIVFRIWQTTSGCAVRFVRFTTNIMITVITLHLT